jgi:hypothetical protein
MNYTRPDGVRLEAQSGEEALSIAIGMVETYDPETQMIVAAIIGERAPVYLTISLDAPPVSEEDEGVH